MHNMELSKTEHIEYIDDRLRLIVSPEHTFGTDALLLAAFACVKRKDLCCDFGTGCGIIPFYWLREGAQRVCAVEIQPLACNQVSRSVEMNSLQDRFTLVQGDLRELKGKLPFGVFDLVTMNPPYTPLGKGIISASNADKIARHETDFSLDGMCLSASKLLKTGGRLCICLRPERLTEAMLSMRCADIEPKRLRFVAQRPSKAPWLFLLEGKKGRKSGMIVEPELYIESEEMEKIIGAYRKNGEE